MLGKIPENPNEIQEMQQGREADSLLSHPMIQGALEAMEAYYQRAWMRTDQDDVQGREQAYGMLKCVQAFKGLLTEYVTTGKMAALQKDAREVQAAKAE